MKSVKILINNELIENPNYQIDEDGNIYSLTYHHKYSTTIRKKPLLLHPIKIGGNKNKKYLAVNISDGIKKHKLYYVQHLMIWTFQNVNFKKEGYEVRFVDNNPLNCKLDNIYLMSFEERNKEKCIILHKEGNKKGVIKAKQVEEYNYKGDLLNTYANVWDACKQTNITYGSMRRKLQYNWNHYYVILFENKMFNLYDGWYKLIFSSEYKIELKNYIKKHNITINKNAKFRKDNKVSMYFWNRYVYVKK